MQRATQQATEAWCKQLPKVVGGSFCIFWETTNNLRFILTHTQLCCCNNTTTINISKYQELHAHLNGSIRDETILSLLEEERKGQDNQLPLSLFQHERSLSEYIFCPPPWERERERERDRVCTDAGQAPAPLGRGQRGRGGEWLVLISSAKNRCFEVFSLIHRLTNKLEVIKRITKEVSDVPHNLQSIKTNK